MSQPSESIRRSAEYLQLPLTITATAIFQTLLAVRKTLYSHKDLRNKVGTLFPQADQRDNGDMSSALGNSHSNGQPHSGHKHTSVPRRTWRLQLFSMFEWETGSTGSPRVAETSAAHRLPSGADQAAAAACGDGCKGAGSSRGVVRTFFQTQRRSCRSRVSLRQGWKLFWRVMSFPVLCSLTVSLHWFTQTNTHRFNPPFYLSHKSSQSCTSQVPDHSLDPSLPTLPLSPDSLQFPNLWLPPCFHRQAPAEVQLGRQGRLRSSSLSCGETSYHLPAAPPWHTQ